MPNNKKEWTVPQLIVLVRNRPEETVLGFCKDTMSAGEAADDNTCDSVLGCAATCPTINPS